MFINTQSNKGAKKTEFIVQYRHGRHWNNWRDGIKGLRPARSILRDAKTICKRPETFRIVKKTTTISPVPA